ncbi:MAG: hypothetical protein ACOYT4_04150 [Nanoarchaeota archaeon]
MGKNYLESKFGRLIYQKKEGKEKHIHAYYLEKRTGILHNIVYELNKPRVIVFHKCLTLNEINQNSVIAIREKRDKGIVDMLYLQDIFIQAERMDQEKIINPHYKLKVKCLIGSIPYHPD